MNLPPVPSDKYPPVVCQDKCRGKLAGTQWGKPSKFKRSPSCLKPGTANWNTGGSKPPHITFKRGHALPLVGTRILRPRRRRGEATRCPRVMAGSWPVAQRIHVRDLAANRTRTQTMRNQRQSVSAFYPRQLTRLRIFHDLEKSSSLLVHEHAAATDESLPLTSPQLRIVHARESGKDAIYPQTWTGKELSVSLYRHVHLAPEPLGSHQERSLKPF